MGDCSLHQSGCNTESHFLVAALLLFVLKDFQPQLRLFFSLSCYVQKSCNISGFLKLKLLSHIVSQTDGGFGLSAFFWEGDLWMSSGDRKASSSPWTPHQDWEAAMVDDGKEMVATDLSRGGGDSTRGWVGWLFSGESVALRFFHWFLWSDGGRKSPPRLLLQISGRSLTV